MFELTPFTNGRMMDIYNPFREMAELERKFFSGNATGSFVTDIRDTGSAYVLEADLPGMKKEDIHIDIDGDRLSISAQRNSSREEKDSEGNYIRCERFSGSFSRSFDISGIRSGHHRCLHGRRSDADHAESRGGSPRFQEARDPVIYLEQ